MENPGPGNYLDAESFTKMGKKQFNSKSDLQFLSKVPISTNQPLKANENPGPGSYETQIKKAGSTSMISKGTNYESLLSS